MKKSMVICAGICASLLLTSCGAKKEAAYRQAYEKAQAQEQTVVRTEEAPVVTPVVTQPSTQTKVVDNYDNVPVRSENVSIIDGSGLKAYSVVVGSFSLKANAQGLQSRLINAGYQAQIAYNPGNNMYRVVASTYSDKGSAVASRDQLRNQYPDAWLLFAK